MKLSSFYGEIVSQLDEERVCLLTAGFLYSPFSVWASCWFGWFELEIGTASFYRQRTAGMFHGCTLSSNPPPHCLCFNTKLLSPSSSANPPHSWSQTQHKGNSLKVVCFYVAYLWFFYHYNFKSSIMLKAELILRVKKSLPLHRTERIELGNSASLLVFLKYCQEHLPCLILTTTFSSRQLHQ